MSDAIFEKRLFVASIPTDDLYAAFFPIRLDLEKAFYGVKFRWERQFHITIRFMGEVDIVESADVLRELWKNLKYLSIRNKPFHLTINDVQTFPGVVWAGLADGDDKERLSQLAEQINGAIDRQGFPQRDFPLIPHITIGRFQPNDVPVNAWIAENGYIIPKSIKLDRIELVESFRDIYGVVSYRPLSAECQFLLGTPS